MNLPSVLLSLIVGLLGSAYAAELRALFAYGPRKFSGYLKTLDRQEDLLLDRLHQQPTEVTTYLGKECFSAGVWALALWMAARLLTDVLPININPWALAGGIVFSDLVRVNRVMRHLWKYESR